MCRSNRLGERVVENFRKAKDKSLPLRCYEASHARIAQAAREVSGDPLPPLDQHTPFGMLWGSHIGAIERPAEGKAYIALPLEYRGKGGAGAMAYLGRARPVDYIGVWAGALQPGAIMQVWRYWADYVRVRDGEPANNKGHSFIFIRYVMSGSAIAGMLTADQGNHGVSEVIKKSRYSFWAGANLCTTPPRYTGRGPSPD
jgi:hypothetical protein